MQQGQDLSGREGRYKSRQRLAGRARRGRTEMRGCAMQGNVQEDGSQ